MAQRPFFNSNGPLQGKAPPGNRRGFPLGMGFTLNTYSEFRTSEELLVPGYYANINSSVAMPAISRVSG